MQATTYRAYDRTCQRREHSDGFFRGDEMPAQSDQLWAPELSWCWSLGLNPSHCPKIGW